jgi:O2-independent ubiquinone biosynthesis protein UbiV
MTANLVLGPVLFNWQPDKWRDFYFRMADEADVDTVCVGEVVCSKRAPFFASLLPDVIERLQTANKQVILSTLVLIMNKREMEAIRSITAPDNSDDSGILIEANDISATALLKGRAHTIGPFVNIYNEGTLDYVARNGAKSVCLPVELGLDAIRSLVPASKAQLEVFAFGRLPLAVSSRCYHARAHDLHKDSCQFVCDKDPDGMDVDTLDNQPFLAVNGVQTMSHGFTDLTSSIAGLQDVGVERFRLSPHSNVDMVKVAGAFRAVSEGQIDSVEARAAFTPSSTDITFCNGYMDGGIASHMG